MGKPNFRKRDRCLSPEECSQLFPDEPAIGDEVALLRRIPPWHFYIDPSTGQVRPSSAAFEDDRGGDPMSVYRRDAIESDGSDIGRVLRGHLGYRLAALPAGQYRLKLQSVHPDPLLEETAHTKNLRPEAGQCPALVATQSIWAIRPPS